MHILGFPVYRDPMHTLEHLQMPCKDHTPPGLRGRLSSLPRCTILQLHRMRFEAFDTRAHSKKNSEMQNRTGVYTCNLLEVTNKREMIRMLQLHLCLQCEIVWENLAVLNDGKPFTSPFIGGLCVRITRCVLQETHRVIECWFLKISFACSAVTRNAIWDRLCDTCVTRNLEPLSYQPRHFRATPSYAEISEVSSLMSLASWSAC